MTTQEQQEAAKAFASEWENKQEYDDNEKAFWTAILQNVYGISHAENLFQLIPSLADLYIPIWGVVIEQKALTTDPNSLKEFINHSLIKVLNYKATYNDIKIDHYIVCNYKTFIVCDLTKSNTMFEQFNLSDFENNYHKLPFKSITVG